MYKLTTKALILGVVGHFFVPSRIFTCHPSTIKQSAKRPIKAEDERRECEGGVFFLLFFVFLFYP